MNGFLPPTTVRVDRRIHFSPPYTVTGNPALLLVVDILMSTAKTYDPRYSAGNFPTPWLLYRSFEKVC